MKVFATHSGVQLNDSDTFTHEGVEYRMRYCVSDCSALIERADGSRADYYTSGQLGLEFHTMPDWIVMNRRTGLEAVEGDWLPNGMKIERLSPSRESARTNTAVRILYNSTSCQLDFIPRVRFNQTAPVLPEYKRGCGFDPQRDTGHMLINGEWRPYRQVRQLDGEYYWIGESAVVDGAVFPLSDTTTCEGSGRCILLASAVEYGGKHYDPRICIGIGEVFYPRDKCFRVVDSHATMGHWLPPHAALDGLVLCKWLGTGGNTYANADDVVDVACGGHHPSDDVDEWNDDDYPTNWIDNHTFVCDGCGYRFHNDDYDSDGRCSECYSDYDDEDRGDHRIHDCCCRDAAKFAPEEDIPLKFGIEFEVESKSNQRSELLDHFDEVLPDRYAIYKDDGSLNDYNGVEIVTRPDSPAVHKRVWREALNDEAQRLFNISSSCGIHIHVSRAPLTPSRIGRMLVFVNSPANEQLIRAVAGRYNASYCNLRGDKKIPDGKRDGRDRYEGLNLTNSKTIEFRLFDSRSSKTPEGFIKNIEFVEALLAFTDIAQSGNRGLDTPSFMCFLNRRRKDYPVLNKFLSPVAAS